MVAVGDAADLVEEIHMPGAAAHLAIGDALEAEIALQLDPVTDSGVLGGAQRGGRKTAGRVLGAGLQQRGRAQQTADMIGAERTGHILLPFSLLLSGGSPPVIHLLWPTITDGARRH